LLVPALVCKSLLVHFSVVEVSVPLPRSGNAGQFGEFGVAGGDEGKVLEVLGGGIVVEGSAVVLYNISLQSDLPTLTFI
jgi:hypothetical protein